MGESVLGGVVAVGFAKFHEMQGFSAGALALFALGFGLTAMCIILLAVEEMQNL